MRKRSRLSLVYAALLFLGIAMLFWQEPRHEWTSLDQEPDNAPTAPAAAAAVTGAQP